MTTHSAKGASDVAGGEDVAGEPGGGSPHPEVVDLRFLEADVERVDVGSGVVIDLWPDGRIGFEHVCPGTWREEGDDTQYLVAPFWGGDRISPPGAPLTLTPSLLCLGAGLPCGLHGFVTDGVWRAC